MGLRALLKSRIPQSTQCDIAGEPVTVTVRANPRARRYRLAVSSRGEPVLTIPKGGRWAEAERFLLRHRDWLGERLARRGTVPDLAPGETIPIRGVGHTIAVSPRLRGRIEIDDGPSGIDIIVPGGPDHFRRRLIDWLKDQARADLETRCAHHAATLGVGIAGLRIRDQSGRWGSCSSARVLNFNWRLVLAPPHVLDYVAAHEVAHILEMNHAPAFWATVERALPDYRAGRVWLRENGQELMAIGRG